MSEGVSVKQHSLTTKYRSLWGLWLLPCCSTQILSSDISISKRQCRMLKADMQRNSLSVLLLPLSFLPQTLHQEQCASAWHWLCPWNNTGVHQGRETSLGEIWGTFRWSLGMKLSIQKLLATFRKVAFSTSRSSYIKYFKILSKLSFFGEKNIAAETDILVYIS